MSAGYTDTNLTHKNNLTVAEGVRQTAVAAASTQAAVQTAEISYYRTCLASAIKNSCGVEPYMVALRGLGVTGA
jgi:hypothetical protein